MKRSYRDQTTAPKDRAENGGHAKLPIAKPARSAECSTNSSIRHCCSASKNGAKLTNDSSLPPKGQATTTTILTPHTLRLLKLILEGTAEHAGEASVHLTNIASSQCSATQLWEILGRLQEGLTSSTWKTRNQAACALQGIAQQLPLSDQILFLKKQEDEVAAVLPSGDDNDAGPRTKHQYLTLQDLSMGGLDSQVLIEGRLLMATSHDRYNVTEERELHNLDRSALMQRNDGSASSSSTRTDFVERRRKLQRHILAQRLGLAGIGNVLGEQNVLPQAITSEDMADATMSGETPSDAKRLRREKRTNQENLLQQETDDSFSVRALLVMEMEEQQRRNGNGGSVLSSHRNPQELLATELVYRMFDPAWHVRHGALLGTLSLLRAWKTYANGKDDLFGQWPQDVLARCLCILALDRFGDFSGALGNVSTSNVTGSVIAPVREVAGQLISVLFVVAPEMEQQTTLDLLFRLCEYSAEWEPRHGALVALKYILAVLTKNDQPKEGFCDADSNEKTMNRIVQISLLRLRDSSDDVKGTAALVAAEYLRSYKFIPSFLLERSADILLSIKAAASFSSCVVDLVQLLAEMLRIDAKAVVTSLSTSKGFVSNIRDLSDIILDLLDSDYESVRSSALRSIIAFSGLLCSCPAIEIQNDFYSEAARTCRRFVETLFHWYFTKCSDAKCYKDDFSELSTLHDEVWNNLMAVVHSLSPHTMDEMQKLESSLLRRYFWNESILRSTSEENNPIFPQASSAMASFLAATNGTLSTDSQVALTCLLHSPWVYHCEASCLLFASLYSRKETFSGLENVRLSLESFLEESPLCLIVSNAANIASITRDKAFYDFCERVYSTELSRAAVHTESVIPSSSYLSKSISEIWATALESRGLIRATSSTAKSTCFCSMRVEACISGAIVVSGLPAKVTPVVRSLMTSLKNEVDPSRQALTCTSLVLLVEGLRQKPSQAKILDKICSMANGEDSSGTPNDTLKDIAGSVLCSVTRGIASGGQLKAIRPFWSRLSILLSCSKNDEKLASATRFLLVFTSGLKEGTELVDFLIDNFTEALVRLFSIINASEREHISTSLSKLCSMKPDQFFMRALPVLLNLLDDQSDDQVRWASCSLLKDLVEVSGTTASRFVKSLLPVVMKLMTDRNEACSNTANALFADMVRVAPLAQGNLPIPPRLDEVSSKCENVIDHLIFGKPLPPCEIPDSISMELRNGGIHLRKYQMEGISFLRFLHSVRLNGAICDSMGIGKTIQALVAVAICDDSLQKRAYNFSDNSPAPISLVVCPSSVVGHWVREVKKYFSGGTVFRSLCYAGAASARRSLRTVGFSQHNIVITSYSVLRSDVEFLAGFEWTCCILDEGHLLKNPQTATARASKRLKSTHRIILTGTPVQNRVSEIWAMFDFLLPNFLGTWKCFSKEYARPITRSQQPGASAALVQEGMAKLKLLHQQVLPFILRREKEHVLTELPPKNVTVVRVPMSDLQQDVYQNFCASTETRRTLEAPPGSELSNALVSGEGLKTDVLKSLLFLRLLCTHPSLVIPARKERDTLAASWFSLASSGKLIALVQLLAEAGIYDDSITAADNDESFLYCDDGARTPDAFGDVVSFHTDAHLGPSADSGSAKSKCLIFSQFSASLDIVEELLFKQKMPSLRYLRLDGSVPSEQRADIADAFNNDSSVSVMLLTTRVGGLGLNLVGADIVIFLESDFNPFADLQAMDRAHRIGQNRTVNVYRIITENSIEEKILELQERKMATSEAIVNSENSTMYQMGTERLLDIFSFKTTSTSIGEALGDYDLDSLMERFADDYSSLSVTEFTRTLK